MGSIEGFDKKSHPVGNVIQRHINEHNAKVSNIIRIAPFRIKLMWAIGNQFRNIGRALCKPLEERRR